MDASKQELKYVLAMYDVRGKQNFIYRSTHIKEIIGGSDIIRTIFQRELYDAAKEYRNEIGYQGDSAEEAIYDYHHHSTVGDAEVTVDGTEKFSFSAFQERMEKPQYVGEVVYDGGGNFFILYRSEDICKEITYRFTKKVIEKYISLRVVCTYVDNLNPDRYHGTEDNPGDYERLYKRHRFIENELLITLPYGTLPIVQADYLSSMPLSCFAYRSKAEKQKAKLTTESYAKYSRYEELQKNKSCLNGLTIPDEKILDKMVTQKGEESLLAVIYMDGNNMGASVEKCLAGKVSYDECVNQLRSFSAKIQKVFIDDQAESFSAGSNDRMRLVIGAGDEVTVICNSRDAYSVVKAYMEKLEEINTREKSDENSFGYTFTSCAGIAIFHSHAPYAEAYRIAEECCESAKSFMRDNELQDVCMLDYHYCQGAIGVSLKQIRRDERTTDCSRPWLITDCRFNENAENNCFTGTGFVTRENVLKMVKLLNIFGRSNTKGLNVAAQRGNSAFELEIRRIEAHMTSYQKRLLKESECSIQEDIYKDIDSARKLIEDIVIVYDLWSDEWQKEMKWQDIVAKAESEGEQARHEKKR